MDRKIILSVDSTCDLTKDLIDKYDIKVFPYTITLEGEVYKDNVDITPPDIFKAYRSRGSLPKTSSVNAAEYYTRFKEWVDEGYEVIHINLASSLSSSYSNACLASSDLKGVYPIDSQNLSAGSGLLSLRVAKLIEEGISAEDIVKEVESRRDKIHTSFVLDTLDFLYAGGRCSKVSSLGSNMLKIKPVINVDNSNGTMGVGKKYRGTIDKVLPKYINDKMKSYKDINTEVAFLGHSGVDQELLNIAENAILNSTPFKKVYTTLTSCTISSHCGPNTFGFAFETNTAK